MLIFDIDLIAPDQVSTPFTLGGIAVGSRIGARMKHSAGRASCVI